MRKTHGVAAAAHLGLIVVDQRYRDLREAYADDITRTRHFNSAADGNFISAKRSTGGGDDDTDYATAA